MPLEAFIFLALLLVIAVKGYTTHSINGLESKIRAAQSDEADISERLQATESSLRTLEKDHKVLGQEIKHLENDKDLATLEVAKAGGKPITEEQLQQLLNPTSQPRSTAQQATGKKTTADTKSQPEAAQDGNSQTETHDPSGPGTTSTHKRTEGAKQTTSKHRRILVVDDNDELRALLLQALSSDYEVLDAPDGFEALNQVLKQKENYDLIITDLNMPKVNGIQLLTHLPKDIPTIVISAFLNKPEFKKSLAELQPASVLEKPFQIASLRSAIQLALSP
ncbi:MAG: response regulator [Candidatus Latescibacteria bacterium]|jgi:two-component system, cell cycle response regulator CpdR|nr:response regulator [Candidatus Latescibacterota bacterium]